MQSTATLIAKAIRRSLLGAAPYAFQSAELPLISGDSAKSLVSTRENAIPSKPHAVAAAFRRCLATWHQRIAGV